jgi:hypothetical protein
MIKNLVDTLKKTLKIIHNMFTEANLATAQIAQLFGSELLKVQNSATTDSGSQPNIVNIDPKQFLTSEPQYRATKRADEQRLMQMMQREAEAAYPLPEQAPLQQPIEPQAPAAIYKPQVQHVVPISASAPQVASGDSWARIATSLERIANKLESVDIAIKKKRIKRTSK